MENSDQTKDLLRRCELLFFKYGVRSVTMDDIARELSISKKTLYQHFENKDELINEIMKQHTENECNDVLILKRDSKDALEEIIKICQRTIQMLRMIPPNLIFELKKYHVKAWDILNTLQNNVISNGTFENIKRGISEGLYRPEVNPEIISKLYAKSCLQVIDEELFPSSEFKKEKVLLEFMNYHVLGISTPKGMKKWEQYFSELKNHI